MSPSVAPLSPHSTTQASTASDPRPSKRARKAPPNEDNTRNQYGEDPPAVVDHIFISESLNSSKKPGGKKAPLSCCECRRLKLKCDRSFPCGSCKKRGVSDICPDGVLVSGKGTRFILANTEQLHTKIHDMSDHIRKLEEALEAATSRSHSLLTPDNLSIKSTMELYGPTQGKQERSEPSNDYDSRSDRQSPNNVSPHPSASSIGHDSNDSMNTEIQRMSRGFPLADGTHGGSENRSLKQQLQSSLPPRVESDYLWEQTKHNALWQYNPHTDETFYPNLAHHCYATPPDELSTRRIALLYMILAIGCKVDIRKRVADSPDAEHYHMLARAALSEVSVLDSITVETITALFYEIWYLLVFSDTKTGGGHAWGLMGLTAKLAQSIGLHRNGSKSKIFPEEVEKRRSLFWELLYLDARLSLSLGRPPSFSIKYMDCPRPIYVPDAGWDPSQSSHHYQEWKHSFYIHCLAPVLDAISQPGLEYTTVISLDRMIRDFNIPSPLASGNDEERTTLLLQRTSHIIALETMILQLHRSYFLRALSGPEQAFNRRHPHAPSVVAVFLSATRLIATIERLYTQFPELSVRISGYWSNAFSSAVALCVLVSRAPFTCLSAAILQELERTRLLFLAAASPQAHCPRARQVGPVLQAMIGKANGIFTRWYHGQEVPTVVLRHTEEPMDTDTVGMSSPVNTHLSLSTDPNADSFAEAHVHLKQCIAEVHERAKFMFPMRKPCQCSLPAPSACPPSHSWSPPPMVDKKAQPLLPELYPHLINPLGFTTPNPSNPTFTGANVNFELGALHPSTEQMAWF